MMRRKLKLAYIANASLRKSTFNKRKKGLMKKTNELSTLYGIDACVVMYSPFRSHPPEVWPSHAGVVNVIKKFEMLSKMEQEKKMVNHESFLRQNVIKAMENNNKREAENTERTLKEAMFQVLRGNGHMLNLTDEIRQDLCKYMDNYLKKFNHCRNTILSESGESSSAATLMEPRAIVEVGSSSFSNFDVFSPSQPTNDIWGLRSTISSNKRPELVNTFTENFLHEVNDQQSYYSMINSVNAYDQNLHLNANNQYPQRFGYPNVDYNAICNPNQNQNRIQHDEHLVNQRMNHHEGMSFPMIDDNNHYYLQES